jgi:hypothetical protein
LNGSGWSGYKIRPRERQEGRASEGERQEAGVETRQDEVIYKRGKHWHMDVTVHGVRYREALDTTDRHEAASLEKNASRKLSRGRASPAGREFARLPFKDTADAFNQDRVGHVAERTVQFEKERFAPMKVFFGEKPLSRIRAEDIKAYQRHRLEARRSGKTINMEIGVLRLMMKRARTWNLVAQNSCPARIFRLQSHRGYGPKWP